jgi:predicted nucleotidyltransferase
VDPDAPVAGANQQARHPASEAPEQTKHPAPPLFEAGPVDDDVFLDVLDRALRAVGEAGIPAVLIGGIASTVYGRPRWSEDIDLLVRPEDADRTLDALAAAGFDVHRTFPDWLYKAFREGVLVDVIFKSTGDIYLDQDMLDRSRTETFRGRAIPVAPAEDLLVMKALAHSEPTPRYWHDALGVLTRADLDWEYLLDRARHGPRRVLSLLLYAQSNDLAVPEDVVERLYRFARGDPLSA